MPIPLDVQILERLAQYLAGRLSIQEFEDWFVPSSWDVRQSGTTQDADLVYRVELFLAEFSNDDWTEEELKSKFRSLTEALKPVASQVPIVVQPQVYISPFGSWHLSVVIPSPGPIAFEEDEKQGQIRLIDETTVQTRILSMPEPSFF